MADFPIVWQNGLKTAGDKQAYPPGFLARMENFIFVPSDNVRPHKIPGRTLAGPLNSATTTANVKGLVFCQFDNGTDILVNYANSRLYEADAALTSVVFNRNAADPDAGVFTRSGNILKRCSDGLNRYLFWTGSASERPLVRDEDGNWRFLGLKKPESISAAKITNASAATIVRPTTDAHPTATSEDPYTSSISFASVALAYDDDATSPDTYAYQRLTGPMQQVAGDFYGFNANVGSAASHKIKIRLATSSASPSAYQRKVQARPSGTSPATTSEPLAFRVTAQISENAGSTYKTIFQQNAPVPITTIEYTLANSTLAWNQLRVRVIGNYLSGTAVCSLFVYDIKAISPTGGGSELVPAGTYHYAMTEVYTVKLASGKVIVVESSPSNIAEVTVAAAETTVRGVTLTLPSAANLTTDGVKDNSAAGTNSSRLHARYIYRSTKTGTYPDLGFIGEVKATDTTFIDTFDVGATVLGSPGLAVVYVGDSIWPLTDQPPPFLDATLHRGSLVGIPFNDPFRIRWAPPGLPEYWPIPHDFAFVPSERGDKARGIVSLGDVLIAFTRTQVIRMLELPLATAVNFDTQKIRKAIISPNVGLAGSPKSYCLAQSEKGHPVVIWVADSGVWMTDGTLPGESGSSGLIQLSSHQDWHNAVDQARLEETRLAFDAVLESVVFDYYDTAGVLRTVYIHLHTDHWIAERGSEAVPKWSGVHTLVAYDRAIGEFAGQIKHWVLDTANLRVLNERRGTDNVGSPITSHLETEWTYPAGPNSAIHVYTALLGHSDWGIAEEFDLELQMRRDATGVIQTVSKNGRSLRGERFTQAGWINRAGVAFRTILRHRGSTTSFAAPVRAIGPLVLQAELVDEVRQT